jgi:hypothetical protein
MYIPPVEELSTEPVLELKVGEFELCGFIIKSVIGPVLSTLHLYQPFPTSSILVVGSFLLA